MFIWDFTANPVMDALIDWSYGQMIGFLSNFFAEMGNMGVELFDLPWVQAIVLFFSQLAWALFGVGLVVAGFECGIEYASGRGDIQQTALSATELEKHVAAVQRKTGLRAEAPVAKAMAVMESLVETIISTAFFRFSRNHARVWALPSS